MYHLLMQRALIPLYNVYWTRFRQLDLPDGDSHLHNLKMSGAPRPRVIETGYSTAHPPSKQ